MGKRLCRPLMTRHCEFGMQKMEQPSSDYWWATQIGSCRLHSPLMGRRSCCAPMTRQYFGMLNPHPLFLRYWPTVSLHGNQLDHPFLFTLQSSAMVGLPIHITERCCGFQRISVATLMS